MLGNFVFGTGNLQRYFVTTFCLVTILNPDSKVLQTNSYVTTIFVLVWVFTKYRIR